MKCRVFWYVLTGLFSLAGGPAFALAPGEVAVVFNKAVPVSESLADSYMALRGIPASQKLRLFLTDDEAIDRETYEEKVAGPVRRKLKAMPHVRCLVTVYGVPLKVVDSGLTPNEDKERQRLLAEVHRLEADLEAAPGDKAVQGALGRVRKTLARQRRVWDKNASVDSELMLVKRKGTPTSFWVPNPLFVGRKGGDRESASEVLLVSRLDGPAPATVRRLMDDAVAVEREGLSGVAYFDARWKVPDTKKTGGYALYDYSIHRGADRLESQGRLRVVRDDRSELFSPGACPDAALYCGWYSLGAYVDSFAWKRGAVGYHIASTEMTTLKDSSSPIWCVQMLERGVAATIGPVGEPYVQAFPLPEVFFGLLAGGRMTLVECYAASLPFLSWKMVLVGDPLYRPFDVRPSSPASRG